MNKFILVHENGKPRLINLAWVEEIRSIDYGCTIYFAFTAPGAFEQDYMYVDETFETVVEKVKEA